MLGQLVRISVNDYDLSDNDDYLSDLNVDLSDTCIMSTFYMILLLSVWHYLSKNTFFSKIYFLTNE